MATHEVKSMVKVWRWACALALLLCASCYESGENQELGGDSHFLRSCQQQADCADLAGKSCIAGYCRGPGDPTTGDGSSSAPAPSGSGQSNQSSGSPGGSPSGSGERTLDDSTPLVMLLVDTSGSLERMADCTCQTPGCEECLPDCSRGDRNRWANVLEALTGTFENFSCEAIQRTSFVVGVNTYDVGYYLPYNKPSGKQRDDGVLDEYRDRLRFGLATFDGYDTWVGAAPLVPPADFAFDMSEGTEGQWSYSPQHDIPNFTSPMVPGSFKYPNCVTDYFMDTGICNASAEQGALQIATDPATAGATNDTIQDTLLAVRPYGGTPIAASFDDLYYLFAQDEMMQSERARSAPRHIVLITDGYPDDDYRSFGCNCNVSGDPSDGQRCGDTDDPSTMHCPYPTPEEGARALRCGQDPNSCDAGVVSQVHVVSFADADPTATTRMDQIAMEGGGQGAHHAFSALQLRQALDDVFSSIAQ
jgi:hypothetical protein